MLKKKKSEETIPKKITLQKTIKKIEVFVYREKNLKILWNYIKFKSQYFDFENIKTEDWEIERLNQLREVYPELNQFQDEIVLREYDNYQNYYNLVAGYDVYREEAFLFYFLCKLANIVVQDPEHLFVGEYIGYYLVRGKSLTESKQLALKRAITLYPSTSEVQKGRACIEQVSLAEIVGYYNDLDTSLSLN